VTDLLFDDPCIVFALRREAQPFLREFRPHQRFPGAPCWARFCGPSWLTVLVLETGVGESPTTNALNWALGRPVLTNVPYQPKLVLSAGFSGALVTDLKVGDVVLATDVCGDSGKRWPATWPMSLPGGEWRPALHRGSVFSSSQLIGHPNEKLTLAQRYDAIAVDMETAAIARACQAHDVPFGCVRAISDEVSTTLSPKLLPLLSGRRVSSLGVTGLLLRSPGMVRELWRLQRDTRYAARQLVLALGELLTLTLPWGRDLG
jgi:hypothetical protein